MSETSDLTGPLRKMYEQAGALVFRMQSGKIPLRGRWVHLCKEGTADLLVFPRNGGVLWIETKDPKGRTGKERAEAQARFKQDVEAFGHKYVLVKDLDQGIEALNRL